MDDIVLFKPLTISDMSSIVDKILTELNIRLMAQYVQVVFLFVFAQNVSTVLHRIVVRMLLHLTTL
jgi:ATP-dependent Clp protease ATP-binding subunit ClpA